MKLWYAVLRDREDTDWGYGSYICKEAESMAVNIGPDAYIAVIDNEGDPFCVAEIEQKDFVIRKEYAIIIHNIDEAPSKNEDVLFESQDPEEIIEKLAELDQGENDMTEYTIEEYTVDEDGNFFEGSDFDTVANFRRRVAAARSVKDICRMAHMSQNAVADRYSIPRRTFGNWCTGSRECPVYIRLMMQELLGLYRR